MIGAASKRDSAAELAAVLDGTADSMETGGDDAGAVAAGERGESERGERG